MRVVTWLVVAVALWLPAATAAAETFEAGMAAYEAEDYAKAYEVWKPLAEAGDPRAQYELGNLYRFAEGVEQDYAKALDWLTKAARQQKDPDMMRRAVYGLGYMVKYGHGVEKDIEKAECLYRALAEAGNATAQFALCETLTSKPGIDLSAIDWCKRAGRQGYLPALREVGMIYLFNPFKDMAEGYTLLIVAERKGEEGARKVLEEGRASGDQEVLGAIERAERRAEEWLPRVEPEQPISVAETCLP